MSHESKTTKDIISDEEIERVHANANFGRMTKRQVVDEGVLKYASGYTTGHTMFMILHEHGLIRKSTSYKSQLTVKGQYYFRAMLKAAQYTKLYPILVGGGQ